METYKQHYEKCKNLYGNSDMSIYDVSIHVNDIKYDQNIFDTLCHKISKKFKNNLGCVEDKWAIKLNEWREINELEDFCQEVIPQIEERYFGCFASVDFIHPYKVKSNSSQESSWAWHYDDCPKEFIKLVIYLNNTVYDNGCMQYIYSSKVPIVETFRLDPSAIKGFPPPVFPKTRVPHNIINNIIENGGSINSIVGKAGTNFIFTPNIIHRGTIPSIGTDNREAIFFFIRPSLKRKDKYVNEQTYSFSPERNVKKYILN